MKLSTERLRIAMARAKMSYTALSKSVSASSVNRALKGENIKPITAGKIASALGVDVEELLEVK